MKKVLLGLTVAAGLAVSTAGAATLDFVAEANNHGERGVANGTTLNIDGLDVTFSSNQGNAYFDESSVAEVALGGAGLGVCSTGLKTNAGEYTDHCVVSSDDNVTSGESVTISFALAQTLSSLLFNEEGHFRFAGAAATGNTLLFAINGGSLMEYTFADLMAATFTNVLSATFAFGGSHADQFYVAGATAVAPVPVPAGALLLLSGLGALGVGAMRRRKAAV